jgi:hypothetical protein
MKTFRVSWTETLWYEDEIEATDYDEAEDKAHNYIGESGVKPHDSETATVYVVEVQRPS